MAIRFIAAAALLTAGIGAAEDPAPAKTPVPISEARPTSSANGPSTQPTSGSGSMVNDVQVELALFGSETHLADVTDRVVELLRSEPQGFMARADWLRIDPAPGKTKSLLIRYRYHDHERYYVVTGPNRASYSSLVEGIAPR